MKKLMVFILLFMTIIIMANQVMAFGLDDIVQRGDDFINKGDPSDAISEDQVRATSKGVFRTLLIIGVIVAIIGGAIIGIQFLMGSVEAKAQIKEKLIPYVVGCAIMFGAFGIWKVVVDILQGVNW